MKKNTVMTAVVSTELGDKVEKCLDEMRPRPSRSAFLTMLIVDYFASDDMPLEKTAARKHKKKKKRERS